MSKVCTQSTCSLSVRMNRSATPLPSDSHTKAGLDSIPGTATPPGRRPSGLAAVIMSRLQPGGDAGRLAAEDGVDALPERLQRLEPRPGIGRVNADAFRRAVIDDHEDGGGPLAAGQATRRIHWAAIGPWARDLAELFQGKFGTLELCDVWTG